MRSHTFSTLIPVLVRMQQTTTTTRTIGRTIEENKKFFSKVYQVSFVRYFSPSQNPSHSLWLKVEEKHFFKLATCNAQLFWEVDSTTSWKIESGKQKSIFYWNLFHFSMFQIWQIIHITNLKCFNEKLVIFWTNLSDQLWSIAYLARVG